MCTWCRPRELISPVSFFTLLYQRILHENRVFLFLYIFPVAKRQLMGELTCVYKSQRHGLDLLRITSVTRHLLRWFGAKKLKLTGLLFGLHADLKCAEVCYKNMMPWTNMKQSGFCTIWIRTGIWVVSSHVNQIWSDHAHTVLTTWLFDCWLLSFYILEEQLNRHFSYFYL